MKHREKQTIYLNDADGRKPARLDSIEVKQPERQLNRLRDLMSAYWGVDKGAIEFAQNTTTHIAYLIEIIKTKYPDAIVFLDSHEIKWLKKTIENGKLPLNEMTYGNYVRHSYQHIFPKSEVKIFTISNIVRLRKTHNHTPVIIVISHVSRQTGEIVATKKLLASLSRVNRNAFFIIDGAQFLGPIPEYIKHLSGAYLTVSSKFIGAEPHLGVAYLSNNLKRSFPHTYPHFESGRYIKEIYSAVCSLSQLQQVHSHYAHIRFLRTFCFRELRKNNNLRVISPRNQVPWIVTVRVGNNTKTWSVVKLLKEQFNVSVYQNISFSVSKPDTPMIRISISPRTRQKDIQILAQGLSVILSNSQPL